MSPRPLPSSFDDDKEFFEEDRLQKLTRRIKEEPLIPIGCALTCWALYQSSRSIRMGDKVRTNRMFRARIYAQGFTVAALVAGSYYWQKERDGRKAFETTVAEKKAKEKQAAWIRELEIRDQEDKDLQERAKKYAALQRQAQEATQNLADPSSLSSSVSENAQQRR